MLSVVEILIKVPLDAKMLQDFSFFELRINVVSGLLNLNKKFVQSFLQFFVYLDTLLTVLKHIRRLVLKQNF